MLSKIPVSAVELDTEDLQVVLYLGAISLKRGKIPWNAYISGTVPERFSSLELFLPTHGSASLTRNTQVSTPLQYCVRGTLLLLLVYSYSEPPEPAKVPG